MRYGCPRMPLLPEYCHPDSDTVCSTVRISQRRGNAGMRRFQAIFAVLAAAAAAMLAGGIPASASTGNKVTTPEEAGYSATGAQFKHVQASVYLRDPAQYAGYMSDDGFYQLSTQLWASGSPGRIIDL